MAENSQTEGKEKDKEKSFAWTDDLTYAFLKVLRQFQSKNGYSTTFQWPWICEEFEKRTGKILDAKRGKNKFTHTKKKWNAWTYLRFKVTGAGWNHETGLIGADDAWWETHKSEEFYTFRKKSPTLEMSDMWDDVYGQISATGKNVIAPSMDPEPATVDPNIVEDHDGDGDDDDVNSEDGLETQTEGLREEEDTAQEFHPSEQPTMQSTFRSATAPGCSNSRRKRKKNSSAATAFESSCAMVQTASKEIISAVRGEHSATSKDKMGIEFREAIKDLKRLVSIGLLQRKSPVWCYAVTELSKEHRREIYMVLEDDDEKVVWLNHEYDMMMLKLPR